MAETNSIAGKETLSLLAEKTYDISEFLVNMIGVSPLHHPQNNAIPKKNVTYHDPCHLRKTLKVYKEPRVLIRANSKYQFREMAEPDACCGMGGSFSLNYYQTSTNIGLKESRKHQGFGRNDGGNGMPCLHDPDERHAGQNKHRC